ncbi:hypothetical protein [Tenacibaculum singaporense]|uniref:Uncharacterized protein n=1 Tax=Tenacibaculum singaporense TaxID=2358479 RepID=A0A3Q8RR11_9FLAO|nr:hypothetical protein [Tenacibaculum singaporense]AZJ34850.1 hypothetical protein D6T69_04640 [Tenacibaculum singaporense]
MLPSYQNSIDLLTNVASQKLYKQLIVQLNKDFSLTGIDLDFSANNTPSELKEKLQKSVKELILHDFNSYTNLLYRIDVSEKDSQITESNDIDRYTENVTFLILKRTWKKVWFKNQFSK